MFGCDVIDGLVGEDAPFSVEFSIPVAGGTAEPDSTVALGFSEPVDDGACRPAVALVAVDDDARVLWPVPFALASDGSSGYDLDHEPFVVGVPYALVVQAGEGGCLSARGDELQPFASFFEVE